MRRRAKRIEMTNAELAVVGYEAARSFWNNTNPDAVTLPPWRDLDADRSVTWIEAAKAIRAALADAPPAGGAPSGVMELCGRCLRPTADASAGTGCWCEGNTPRVWARLRDAAELARIRDDARRGSPALEGTPASSGEPPRPARVLDVPCGACAAAPGNPCRDGGAECPPHRIHSARALAFAAAHEP